MPISPLRPTAVQTGILGLAAAGLVWLLAGLAGGPVNFESLPGAGGYAIACLRGETAALRINQIAASSESDWQAWTTPGFIPPRHPESTAWVRVKLSNPASVPLTGILADAEHYEDHVECYLPAASGNGWTRLLSGEWTPAADKAVWGRETAFPVTVPALGEQTLYLRYQDFFGNWLQLRWWPRVQEFEAAQLRTTLADGLYFGTLFALLFYTTILWTELRMPSTGSYVLYLGSFMLCMFFGRSVPQILGWPLGSPWMEALLTMFLSASGAFLLSFADIFLELPARLPRVARWLRVLKIVLAIFAIGSLLAPWLGLTALLAVPGLFCVVAHLGVFGCALAVRRAGAPQASWFALAIGALFAGFGPALAVRLNFVSLNDASRIMMAGSAMEMILLATMISDRIGLLLQERITAQKALLVEAEQREALQEAYADDLEFEVRERTAELERTNADKDRILTVLGHDLRSPLTGLTRSAGYWAGRMKDDPATAANDPTLRSFVDHAALTGREVLLLIEDLVMWARLRAGTGRLAPHSLASLVAPVLAFHRLSAEHNVLELNILVPDDPVVQTDLVPIQALLRNLLSNALKAARNEVTIEAALIPGHVRFSVRDDGPGLPEPLAAAFHPDHPSGLPNAPGLGLRLCLEISRALDLRLHAVPLPAGGTEFRFTLPLAA